jgi:hypothetical protein
VPELPPPPAPPQVPPCVYVPCTWMMMEMADFGSLHQWILHLRRERAAAGSPDLLTLPQLLEVFHDVVSGVAHLHNGGPSPVMHRDIKPANLLVFQRASAERGRCTDVIVKVADVGMAKVWLSPHNSLVGTPLFVAPEVARGEYSATVDVFSVGVSMAEVVLRSVADGGGVVAVDVGGYHRGEFMVGDAAQRVAARCPELAQLLHDCCESEPCRRPDSATVLRRLSGLRALVQLRDAVAGDAVGDAFGDAVVYAAARATAACGSVATMSVEPLTVRLTEDAVLAICRLLSDARSKIAALDDRVVRSIILLLWCWRHLGFVTVVCWRV